MHGNADRHRPIAFWTFTQINVNIPSYSIVLPLNPFIMSKPPSTSTATNRHSLRIYPHVFVTVGTTEFQALIDAVSTPSVAQALRTLGCQRLTIQYGASRLSENKLCASYAGTGIKTDVFDYQPSIRAHIDAADLVISHAGAGSCIETLRSAGDRPTVLLVVVNDTLMGNHQMELAERLHSDGYIHCCRPDELVALLSGKLRMEMLQMYEGGDARKLAQVIDEMMHF